MTAAACAGADDEDGFDCSVNASEGTIEGTLDGEDWGADATWTEAGDGVQVVTSVSDGWRLTIVAQQALDAVSDDALPIEVDLGGDEGFVTVYPEAGGSSWTSAGASGSMVLDGVSGDVLSGCLSFDAVSSDGDEVSLDGGSFQAVAL